MTPKIRIQKIKIQLESSTITALKYTPSPKPQLAAILTHGYTSSKNSLLSWAEKLCRSGLEVFLFDLPGHYLGSFNDCETLEQFQEIAPKLFSHIHRNYLVDYSKLIIGGHSLGGLLSLLALEIDSNYFSKLSTVAVTVGLGIYDGDKNHLFEQSFYSETLALRAQYVSPALSPENMFPWIAQAKMDLKVTEQNIHMITGTEDLVAPPSSAENLAKRLKDQNNTLSTDIKSKIPHHKPELASGNLKKFLKSEMAQNVFG